MKKLILALSLVLVVGAFVACGSKSSSDNTSCSSYPNAVSVTNRQLVQVFIQMGAAYPPPGSNNGYYGGNGGYYGGNSGYYGGSYGANGYGSRYVCVDRNTYYQVVHGGNYGGNGGYYGGNGGYYGGNGGYYGGNGGYYGGNGGQCYYTCDYTGQCWCQ